MSVTAVKVLRTVRQEVKERGARHVPGDRGR